MRFSCSFPLPSFPLKAAANSTANKPGSVWTYHHVPPAPGSCQSVGSTQFSWGYSASLQWLQYSLVSLPTFKLHWNHNPLPVLKAVWRVKETTNPSRVILFFVFPMHHTTEEITWERCACNKYMSLLSKICIWLDLELSWNKILVLLQSSKNTCWWEAVISSKASNSLTAAS